MSNLESTIIEASILVLVGIGGVQYGFRRGNDLERDESNRLKKVARWIGPALIIFGVFVFFARGDRAPPTARELVSQIKSKLSVPVQIDADTRLDDIRAVSDREVEYQMTITTRTDAELRDQRFAEVLEFSISAGACSDSDNLTLLRAGFHLTLSYTSSDGHKVSSITVVPDDCATQLRESK